MSSNDSINNIVWKSLANDNGMLGFAEKTEAGQMYVNMTFQGKVYFHLLLQCTNEAKDPTRLDVLIQDPENKDQHIRVWFHKYMLEQALTRYLKSLI